MTEQPNGFTRFAISAWSIFAMSIIGYVVLTAGSCGIMETDYRHKERMKAIEAKLDPNTLKPEKTDQ